MCLRRLLTFCGDCAAKRCSPSSSCVAHEPRSPHNSGHYCDLYHRLVPLLWIKKRTLITVSFPLLSVVSVRFPKPFSLERYVITLHYFAFFFSPESSQIRLIFLLTSHPLKDESKCSIHPGSHNDLSNDPLFWRNRLRLRVISAFSMERHGIDGPKNVPVYPFAIKPMGYNRTPRIVVFLSVKDNLTALLWF